MKLTTLDKMSSLQIRLMSELSPNDPDWSEKFDSYLALQSYVGTLYRPTA